MKKTITMLLLVGALAGCKSTVYQVDPSVSKHFGFKNYTAGTLEGKSLQKHIEKYEELKLEYEKNMRIVAKHEDILNPEDVANFNEYWLEVLEIYETEIDLKLTNRINDVRFNQYKEMINALKIEMNKQIRANITYAYSE